MIIERDQREVELAKVMNLASGGIDVVLDLARDPLLRTELLPPGYFAPAGDSSRLDQALSDIPELTAGIFEKAEITCNTTPTYVPTVNAG